MANLIAIIGAGASGLAAIKCCLDEDLTPLCFESGDAIGGLWRYSHEHTPGRASVYSSCVMNTSKEMMAFSDFPVPKTFPLFMPHAFVLKYLQMYADQFGLLRYVLFNTCVEKILPALDYETTGRWTVVTRGADGVTRKTVDGVMVCTGHHVHPHIPQLAGLDKFKGVVMHTHDYKDPCELRGKRVLIVGKICMAPSITLRSWQL